MALINAPHPDSTAQVALQQLYVGEPTKPLPESQNLEFIAKSAALAPFDLYRGINLLSGGVASALGADEWAETAFKEVERPAPLTLPTPEHLSTAGRTIGEVTRSVLPFMVPGIGLGLGAANQTARTGIDLVEQGVDGATAGAAGFTSGASALMMAGAGEIAGAGKTLLGTIGRQTAVNVATGPVARLAEKGILLDEYPNLAAERKVFGAEEVGLDLALGLILGGFSHRTATVEVAKRTGKPETEAAVDVANAEKVLSADVRVDDAVRTKQLYEYDKANNPLESLDQHMEAHDVAIRAIDSLNPVDLEGIVLPEQMKPEAIAQAQELAARLQEALPKEQPAMPREPQAETVTVKAMDESGKVTETQMKAEDAIAEYQKTDSLLTQILSCVRGE